jgi:hypothetical protein
MVPPLVAVALDYHEDPTAFEHLRDPALALPDGFPRMLTDLSSALAAGQIDATAEQLSKTPEELVEAARFLFRHVLLDAPGDYYRCLGVPDDASPELIRTHYLLLSRLLHPDRVPNPTEIDLQYARRLNEAYQVLHDAPARRRYDQDPDQRRRNSRPSDPQLFFRRHQPIAPRMTPPAGTSPSHVTRAPLRFGLLVALGMAACTLVILTLWPSTETQVAQSAADTVSESELKKAENTVPDPADDVTAASAPSAFQYSAGTGESPYSESATPTMTDALPQHLLTPLPDGPGPRGTAYEWQGTARNASALPAAGAMKPPPESASQTALRPFPPTAGEPDRLGAAVLGANTPDLPTDAADTDLSIATDPPAGNSPGQQTPEMDASPATTRTFPLIEFESSGYPRPNSQPVHLNP